MESPHCRHNLRAPCVEAGKFECRFNCFGARIAQKESPHASRHRRPEFIEVGGPLIVVEYFGATNQLRRLVLDGGHHGRVGVSQIGGTLASHTVDVLFAIGIPQGGTQPTNDGNAALPIRTAGAHIFVADDFGVGLEG
jgi:hypothetical protein